jgi:pimeloyl-ACP methyl ester carboxylesterase
MATFLLIHGGMHVGWHWSLLRPELEGLGHRTVAPDVPMNEVGAGASVWADVALAAIDDAPPEDVVVVGHSYAGLCLPVIGSRVPVRRLVFLCANVPVPGQVYLDYLDEPGNEGGRTVPPHEIDDEGRLFLTYPVAREVFYGDVDDQLARAAWERLRPNNSTGYTEKCPVDTWPDVPSSYILCTEDRILGQDWSRRVSVERLGGPAIELPGSHSPMLSRPRTLAKTLDQISRL